MRRSLEKQCEHVITNHDIVGMSCLSGGRDWLLHEQTWLSADVWPKALELADSLPSLVCKAADGLYLDELAGLQQALKTSFFAHLLPPTALGSRHSSASHKFHAMCHGLRLENASWLCVQRFLK